MNKFLVTVLLIFCFYLKQNAQTTTGLLVGDIAPPIVLPTSDNSLQSFVFPYQNKMMLLFFWNSSVKASKKDLYKYAKLNRRYSDLEYKTCDGFGMVSVTLQSDKTAWAYDLVKYNLTEINHCIALKGLNDVFIKDYKIKETPTSFLVDEFGKIKFINPDVPTIMGYLDERKNILSQNKSQTKISGKILYSEDIKPLKNSPVYITNERNDTIQRVSTNDNGSFSLNNINTEQNLSISVPKNEQIKEDDKVYLASESGEILSEMSETPTAFEYRLLQVEMVYLKPLKEDDIPMLKQQKALTDLTFTENLNKQGGTALSKDAKAKLDALIVKLKTYPKARVEIISYTDCKGDKKLNSTLSLKRAQIMASYFESKGIDKSRIKAFGRGEDEPLNKCVDGVTCSDAENEINRRTVFKFYQTE